MKANNSILFLILVFSFFQCNRVEQQSDSSEQEMAGESIVQQEAKVQTVAVANTAPSQLNEPNKADVPSVTIDPNKVKSAATNVNLQATTTQTKKSDAPTITSHSSSSPPPPVPEKTPEPEVEPEIEIVEEMAIIPPPNHALFDAILQKAVSSSGKVNYNTIKNGNAELDAYIRELSNQIPDGSWSRNSAMAYWINAYNAFTLKLVADNYPISSIKDLHNGNPWVVKWIKLGDKTYSLDQIENQILRPKYGDARIHFAVNCAAKSCPPLHNRAFTEGNLNSTLNRLTRNFVNNKSYNTINADQLVISQIFNWYAKDFGTLTEFINKYTDTNVNADATIDYQEYNWSLNE